MIDLRLSSSGAIPAFLCKVFCRAVVLFNGQPLFRSTDRTDADGLTDNDLAARAQKNPDEFAHVFDRFFQPVYRYFFFRLRHHDDAEDLTSQTFEKIFRKLHTFQERGVPFSAWVFSIAHHCLVDHVRRRRDTQSIDDLPPDEQPAIDFDLTRIDRALLSEKLWDAIRLLPEKQQQLWALKITGGLPHAEIARILGTTENNVNVMVHRSTHALKRHLAPLLRHDR